MIAFCRKHLAHIKCPRSIDFEDDFPRLPTGKLYKTALRDRYWKGHKSRILSSPVLDASHPSISAVTCAATERDSPSRS